MESTSQRPASNGRALMQTKMERWPSAAWGRCVTRYGVMMGTLAHATCHTGVTMPPTRPPHARSEHARTQMETALRRLTAGTDPLLVMTWVRRMDTCAHATLLLTGERMFRMAQRFVWNGHATIQMVKARQPIVGRAQCARRALQATDMCECNSA